MPTGKRYSFFFLLFSLAVTLHTCVYALLLFKDNFSTFPRTEKSSCVDSQNNTKNGKTNRLQKKKKKSTKLLGVELRTCISVITLSLFSFDSYSHIQCVSLTTQSRDTFFAIVRLWNFNVKNHRNPFDMTFIKQLKCMKHIQHPYEVCLRLQSPIN